MSDKRSLFELNNEYFEDHVLPELNDQLISAGEKVIERALKDIETEMRTKLGAIVIGLIEKNLDVTRMEGQLRILVKHQYPESNP